MQEKIVNFWAQAQGKVRPLYAVINEHGLNGLRQVIREQGLVFWSKAQEQAKAAVGDGED